MSSDAVHNSGPVASSRTARSSAEMARLGVFRAGLVGQLVAAGFFGLVPLIAPVDFAKAFGLTGDEPYLYRLAGAATVGYMAPALLGLLRGSWASLRIPIATTFLFNATAASASLVTIDESGLQPLAAVVALAASIFTAIAAYWLWRGGSPDDAGRQRLEPGFRLTLAGATSGGHRSSAAASSCCRARSPRSSTCRPPTSSSSAWPARPPWASRWPGCCRS